MPAHEQTRTRRHPTTAEAPADERHSFFGRRDFDLSRDLLCVLRFDGTILEANPALSELLGYDRDDLVGRHLGDCIHRDDLEGTLEEARRLAAGGYRTWRFENRY